MAELDAEMLEIVTKEVMQQYEEVRQDGACNMLDRNCVALRAFNMENLDLAAVAMDVDHYVWLLSHFSALMRHYGVSQDPIIEQLKED